MTKKLLILSGSTDYTHKDYCRRYDLVMNKAVVKGYSSSILVSWPGQKSGALGIMNLKTASNYLKDKITALENDGIPYDIIAFSWGANVYLKTLSEIAAPKYLRRTVLWGIDEYWKVFDYFSSNAKTEATIDFLKRRNVTIDSNFFSFEYPNELLLKNYPHSNLIRIGFGENDTDSPPAFGEYLRSFVNKSNISYRTVNNVNHIVNEYNREYLNCLFNDIC